MDRKIDFYIPHDFFIEVKSKSGKSYQVTSNHCTCTGYSFRKTCRHLTEVKRQGLLSKLKEKKFTRKDFFNSPHVKMMRKDAIRTFLKKENIRYTEELVCDAEKFINASTKLEDFLKYISNGK